MAKLTIGNSYSRLTGLLPKQEKELREKLSYVIGGASAYFSGFGPKRRSLIDKKGFFPTGLIHRIEAFVTETIDGRNKPSTMGFGSSIAVASLEDAYAWQRGALLAARNHHRGVISACTGTGKSRVIKLISEFFGLKTLVVVPSIEIKRQLVEVLKDLKNVTIENIDSTALKSATNFDCLIIDEAHHAAAKTYQKLNKTAWNTIYYRFFMTATPFRNDNEETLLFEAIAGKVIYSLDYKTAIENKYIVPVEAYHIEIPKQNTDAYTYQQVYNQLVVNNTPRNIAICNLLTTLHGGGKSTLCLVKEVAHGQLLADITGLPFVSGADDESRKYIRQFNSGGIKVLIATTGIMGEGVDSRPCEYVIIAGLGKAKSQFMQQVGRGVRCFPDKQSAKVILIKDKSHKFLTRHFNIQRAILKDEYGVISQKLEL